jgi:rare lipoprotein A
MKSRPGIPVVLNLVAGVICLSFVACSISGTGRTGVTQSPDTPAGNPPFQEGIASWYGQKFHLKRTSNGEIYNMNRLTAAHRSLPFHTFLLVENLENNRRVIVRINDRGPFVKGRIIDLSRLAAERIGILETGTATVRLTILKSPADHPGEPETEQEKTASPILYTIQAGAFSEIKNAVLTMEHINALIVDYRFRIIPAGNYYRVMLRTPAPENIILKILKILKDNGISAFRRVHKDMDSPG